MIRRAAPLALLLVLAACSPDDSSPDGAVKLFLRATAAGDTAKVYRLLAPESQKWLQQMADRATAQTGGRRRIRPEELLAASVDPPRLRLSRLRVAEVKGNRARVKLVDEAKKMHEMINLVRVEGRWRVLLPRRRQAEIHPGT